MTSMTWPLTCVRLLFVWTLLSQSGWAATFEVTTTAGSGPNSLNTALVDANASTTSADTIAFSSSFNSPDTIALTSNNPTIDKTTGSVNLSAPALLTLQAGNYTALAVQGGTFTVNDVALTGSAANGVTVDSSGILALSNSTISDGVSLNGGTLQTITGLTTSSAVTLGSAGGTVSVNSGQTSTFSGQVGGSGTLVATGAGTLVLSGDNLGLQAVKVTGGGTLSVSSLQNLAEASIQLSAGTLQTTGSLSLFGNVTLAGTGGTIDMATAGTTTSVGPIGGTGGLTVSGAGTLQLGGSNSYTGGTTVQSGATLAADRDYELGAASGGITLNAGTLQTSSGLMTSRAVSLGANGGTVAVGIDGITQLSGSISGAGGLSVNGPGLSYGGQVSLASNNTYQGGTSVTGTMLNIVDDTSLGSSTGGLAINGGTVEYENSFNTSRTITVGAGGATIGESQGVQPNVQTATLSGQITGTGALTLGGYGFTTMAITSTQNNYSGGTTVGFGTTLLIENGTGTSSGSATGTGALTVGIGAGLGGSGTIKSSSFAIQGAAVMVGNGTDATSQMNLTGQTASGFQGADLTFNLGVGAGQGESNTLNLGSTPVTFATTELTLNLLGIGTIQPDTAYTLITTDSPIDPTASGLTVGNNGQITSGLSIAPNSFGSTDYQDGVYGGSYLFVDGDDIDVEVAPEPGAWTLLLGSLGLVLIFRLSLLGRMRRTLCR
jgi:fibronectin-binding autotransporter adhesin